MRSSLGCVVNIFMENVKNEEKKRLLDNVAASIAIVSSLRCCHANYLASIDGAVQARYSEGAIIRRSQRIRLIWVRLRRV